MDSEKKLIDVFKRSLGFEGDDGSVRTAAYRTFPGWDSIAHMHLVAELEAGFDVMLDTDQVIDLSSFAKAKEILGVHGISF